MGIIRHLSLRLHSICSHPLGKDNWIYPQWSSESESWESIRHLEFYHRSSLTESGWEVKGRQCSTQGVKITPGSKLEFIYCNWIFIQIIFSELWYKQSQHKLFINTVGETAYWMLSLHCLVMAQEFHRSTLIPVHLNRHSFSGHLPCETTVTYWKADLVKKSYVG